MEDINYKSEEMQAKMLLAQAQICKNGSSTLDGWCPTTWDGILCWPSTPPGELAVQSCPTYIAGFDLRDNATKQCTSSGEWYFNSKTNSTWSDYSRCYNQSLVTVVVDMNADSGTGNFSDAHLKFLPALQYISVTGYTVSLLTLIVAYCLLHNFKKLRCPRNRLHMHLFTSFILRAITSLLRHVPAIAGMSMTSNMILKSGESIWNVEAVEGNWHCKLYSSIWEYCIMANYSWIFIECLYLHNLLFCTMFSDSSASITVYACLGWGLPTAVIAVWVLIRALYEDYYCWSTHKGTISFEVIRWAELCAVVANFIMFIRIVGVLRSKLAPSSSEEHNKDYRRLARSTLVLVPLFGMHSSIFFWLSYSVGVNEKIELFWLFGDQLISSFQGFFVAVLYCFMNGEVRQEISRSLCERKWTRIHRCCCVARPAPPSSSSAATSRSETSKRLLHGPLHYCRNCWTECFGLHRSHNSLDYCTQDIDIGGTRGCSMTSLNERQEVAVGINGGCGHDATAPEAETMEAATGNEACGTSANSEASQLYDAFAKHPASSSAFFTKNVDNKTDLLAYYSELCDDEETGHGSQSDSMPDTGLNELRSDERNWSDSERSHLAYEMQRLHKPCDP
ncbi:vasoactive intestinal polypeptide receptor 1-like isoform X2 [Trichogramma pretiosum]|uniref:vasoactive intestinal polypeptide receptor 1-like isoform X2 n=1 Tax=Trichogramma pretiosum TaxID=7493 RepID=UPI0006C95449|nr:vasoactive intestinal polypeptide receptor 1-like isoform X2 [Trichogramma pretiosum]